MRRYFRTLILSKTQLGSVFRYEDRFQIYPIESDALKCPFAKHYPLYLEYSVDVDESLNGDALEVITLNEEKEIVRLLTLFTSFYFFYYTGHLDRWGVFLPPIPLEALSKEQQNTYFNQISGWTVACVSTKYHKNECEIKKLTDVSYPKMKFVSDTYKYFHLYAEDIVMDEVINQFGLQKKMIFPETIHNCLDAYYSLTPIQKKIICSAIYLSYDGLEILVAHKALGYLAIAAALEGLTKLFKDSYPELTKNDRYKYPNKENCFVKMLSEYHADSEDYIARYHTFYKTRCDITHDNLLFTFDYGVTLDENNSNPSNEWFTTFELLSCLRIVLTNLLLEKNKLSWIS